jgi:hypothetical protein
VPIVRLDNFQQFSAVNLLLDPGEIPGPKIIPNCCEVRLNWALTDGKIAHNVLYGQYGAGFTPSSAIATAIHQALTSGPQWPAVAALLATTVSLTGVSLRDHNAADQPYFTSTSPAAAGTATGTALPDEVAAVISLQTTKTGPRYRGRMYIPGFTSADAAAGGVMSPNVKTALEAWAGNTIPGALGASGLTWCLGLPARNAYTGSGGRQHPARGPETPGVTGAPVRDNHWDSQRRRGLR